MKRLLCIFITVIILLSCSACTTEVRPDITMFAERLSKIDERYGFEYFDMFIYENVYHVYLSICNEDDVMLSFTLGDNGNIDDLTVTTYADTTNTEEAKKEIKKLFNAVIDSFAILSEKEIQEKEKSLSYNNSDLYFTDIYETFSSLRYNFIFSSNPTYMCLYCEYFEIMSEKQ